MKKTILLIVYFVAQTLLAQTATAPAAGDGTSGNPYQIASLENLYWITATDAVVPSPNQETRCAAHYILTADIDASATGGGGVWGLEGWKPIGMALHGHPQYNFTGSFDGQGFTIDSLYIFRPDYQYIGLFGVASAATIQNLGVTNINLQGGYENVGGIAGFTQAGGSISNCYATGTISLQGHAVGGLVGYNWKANISRCYANVNVTVTGIKNYTGGLIGFNTEAAIQDCYSRGSVSGYNYVGGLVGSHTINTLIKNCYSVGNVTGNNFVGGLVGFNNSTVQTSFWNTDIVAIGIGGGTTTGTTGKTTAEMKTQSTFLDAGWSPAIWNIGDGINDGYPYLDWQNPDGTPIPVELTSFTATTSSASTGSATVTLNWTTATEVNNYGFEIERTSPRPSPQGEGGEAGRGWEKIGFVKGSGNSNSPKEYSFIDKTVLNGKYLYRLKQIDYDGRFNYSQEVEVKVEDIPTEFALFQNYPNPFNPSTIIKYSIPKIINKQSLIINLKVYDVLGNEVATLVNEEKAPGNYEVMFDGGKLASGVYISSITIGSKIKTAKMSLIK